MAAATPYDVVRYSNFPHFQTHPDRLATVAVLHGLEPPPPATARVLEIGCGAGGNLIGIAAAQAGVRAVGVDLAPTVVDEARELAAAAGVGNVEFHARDVHDLTGGEMGAFDFVIAHGVYAWVPPDTRDALMAACATHLAPDGVAYVSYNAHPGGHIRRIIREAAQYHARDAASPSERAELGRELLQALHDVRVDGDPDPWGAILAQELRPQLDAPLATLVHDILGEDWDPVWFKDFAAHAARHELEYVGDARLRDVVDVDWPNRADEVMDGLAGGDRIAYEQYLDLLQVRRFRESILCRAGRSPVRRAGAEVIPRLRFALREADGGEGEGLLAEATAAIAAAEVLPVAFDELRSALGASSDDLAAALLAGVRSKALAAHVDPPPRAAAAGPRPRVSALARHQAALGVPVTRLDLGVARIDEPPARALVTLLDGTRDRDAIRRDFAAATGLELGESDLEDNLRSLADIALLER